MEAASNFSLILIQRGKAKMVDTKIFFAYPDSNLYPLMTGRQVCRGETEEVK